MNNEQMGLFISKLRKEYQMTQKDLATQLNISDKAVSKWERGLSSPDISLLLPLSEILGVTITELLNGERAKVEDMEPTIANLKKTMEGSIIKALEYGDIAIKQRLTLTQSIWATIFSIFLMLGIFIVLVVDITISGNLTWSLIPVSIIIFAWLVFFPTIKAGPKKIIYSLISLSLFAIPFLYTLDVVVNRLIEDNQPIFSLGIRIAPLSIISFWVIFFLFTKYIIRGGR
jgi:transcriptional regulator with XRE-family HTH domain